MKLLVTGGAGFLGSAYVRAALSGALGDLGDCRIIVLDKLTYAGNLENLRPVAANERLEFVRGDVVDQELLEQLLDGVDAVLHFAAESHVDRGNVSGTDFAVTNVVGTQVVVETAMRQGVDRVLHVSSDEVYGSIPEGSASEDFALDPTTPYAASKAAAEHLALSYHRTHNMNVVITRGSNTFGPYQFPEKLIPFFTTQLLDGLPAPVYGDGMNVRTWLHVDDHVRGIHGALMHGVSGEAYNLGGTVEVTTNAIAMNLVRLIGADPSMLRNVADRAGHDRRYSTDSSKAHATWGYAPSLPWDQGLAETVAWYRANRQWWEPLRTVQQAV